MSDIRERRFQLNDKKALLSTLDEVRERILSQDVTGIMITTEDADGLYTVYGSGCEDSRRFAGTLLELAVRRVGFEYRK